MLRSTGVRRPPPEHGRPLGELLATVDRAASKGINVASGGLLAYVPSSGLVTSAVADLIAGVLSRFTGQAVPAPGLVAMESSVLRWIADLFYLPPEAMGVFTTGGSTATLSALITARVAKLRGSSVSGIIYVTEQTHGCVVKAALLAGFRRDNLRVVPVDEHLRMDVTALRSAISADQRRGMRPFFVAASAGTTNAGTIDPIRDLADVAATQDLWLHVDAAYGGFFQLTGRGRERMSGIELADSIVLDPHKSLFVAMGTGCLLVRDSELLRQAHAADAAPYLQDLRGSDLPDFADYSIDLTRDFRGLRVWLPLHLHGVSAFRVALEEKLDLAEQVYAVLVAQPQLAVHSPPVLSTVVFRMAGDDAAVDERTAVLLAAVNAEGRVHLSSTRIDGRMMIRMCILHHRVDAARIEEAVAAILRHSSPAVRPVGVSGRLQAPAR
ncbi:aminotransferase class V-fold PLP-dependent enzyme [Kribbella albertanoniae]|uniref:Aminotransferase class V-fold PLP-dependent enzyme n=2 Tax=Kribbella albertanoniae TaxID=1266829 RepID=A0A4R4QEP1_9ACTN|nr:aminotransferase class V-fold PLP-dependent enzyme [Kribbella albertanoniae]